MLGMKCSKSVFATVKGQEGGAMEQLKESEILRSIMGSDFILKANV